MKAGAIFDMDGLLFDTEVLYNSGWKKVADAHGLTLDPKMLDETTGVSGEVMYETVRRYWPDADVPRMVEEIFEDTLQMLSQEVPVKEGVYEILSYLKESGVKMAVASSSPYHLVMNNLRVAQIDSYFDVVVSGGQVERGKPAPDIFILAAEKLGLAPEDCYVLEDGPNGVHAGAAAGCSTIMVPDLIAPTEELRSICAGVYPSLKEVLEAMKRGDC